MRVEKRVLNDALRVLGKVVCQTSPVELYRSVRFVGDENGIRGMATDGVETVSVIQDYMYKSDFDRLLEESQNLPEKQDDDKR